MVHVCRHQISPHTRSMSLTIFEHLPEPVVLKPKHHTFLYLSFIEFFLLLRFFKSPPLFHIFSFSVRRTFKMSSSDDALPSRPRRPASESVEPLNVKFKTKRSRIHFAKSELKAKASFDSEWWHKAAAYCMELKEHEDLFFRKELLSFMKSGEGDETDFDLTQTAEDSYATTKSYEADYRLYFKQAKRLDTSDDVTKSKRRSFMNLFTGSKLGLGIVCRKEDEEELGFGRRNTKEQSKFRDTLIQTYELRKPVSKHERQVWNIILGGYEPMANLTASHLFAVMAGQDMMTAVFGPEAKKELFSPRNALLLPNPIEEMFDSGLFAIVPAVTDDMSKAEVSLWEHTHP
jgi:hypothetical protein